jgi:hypothetical protein
MYIAALDSHRGKIMKFFDKPWIQLRSTKNKLRSFLRTAPIGTSSSSCSPVGFTIRFDDVDLPGALGTPQKTTDNTNNAIIDELSSCFSIFGKLPVHIICLQDYANPNLRELLIFLKRLEIPTSLSISNGSNTMLLQELIDLQLNRLYFHMWGFQDSTMEATCPNASFNAAEHQLSFESVSQIPFKSKSVLLPWLKGISSDLQHISTSLKQSSFENIQLCAPYFAQQVEDSLSIVQYKELMGSLDTTPSYLFMKLRDMHQDRSVGPGKSPNFTYACPVGSNRLELSILGKLSHCPFHPIKTNTQSIQQWLTSEQRMSHCEKIANCKRSCWHHELNPLGNTFISSS